MSEALMKKSEGEERQLQYMGGISMVPGSYEPENLKAAMDLCQVLCAGGLVPKGLENKPGDVLTLIATGREYGLSWPAALQNLYVVHGRIGSYAEFQRARIMQHPDCEVFELVESTDEVATLRIKKPTMEEPVDVSFTIEEAIQGRLAQRLPDGKIVGVVRQGDPKESNWAKYTADMLVARVTTRAKRRYFPYVLTDLASVEELRDLPPEKDVTPRAGLATERAETIAQAAGKRAAKPEPEPEEEPEEPLPDREAAARHADAMVGDDVDADEPAEEPVQRIPDGLRREILKLEGMGRKALLTLEDAGLVTARHIFKKGIAGLADLPGFGQAKAKTLHGWASNMIDEDLRREALEPKEEPPEDAKEAEKATEEPQEEQQFFREKTYVHGLMKLAEEAGVTKEQLGRKRDELAEQAGLPPGTDPRALPDPQWKKLEAWVTSGKQGSLLEDEEDEAEEEAPEPGKISDQRAGIIKNALRKMAVHLESEDEDPEALEADFYGFLKDSWGIQKIEDLPEGGYQRVLAWLTENDPR